MESFNENEERERVVAEIEHLRGDIQRGLTENDTIANSPLVSFVRLLDVMKRNILDPANARTVFSQRIIDESPSVDVGTVQRFKRIICDYANLPHGRPW